MDRPRDEETVEGARKQETRGRRERQNKVFEIETILFLLFFYCLLLVF
jgi:hypothetical protein